MCRAQHYPWFQVSPGELETHPPWIKVALMPFLFLAEGAVGRKTTGGIDFLVH